MAFRPSSGKKSGVCRDCDTSRDIHTGECACDKLEKSRLLDMTTGEMASPYDCTSCGTTVSHRWAQLANSARGGLCNKCYESKLND